MKERKQKFSVSEMQSGEKVAILSGAEKMRAYYELTKPGIAQMVVLSAAAGYLFAVDHFLEYFADWHNVLHFLAFLVGVVLVASASGTLNHYVERDTDAVMQRTAGRPLPSGRVSPMQSLGFAIVLAVSGFGILALVNFFTLLLAVLTLVSYIAVYTPLKKRTVWNTYVGAIPGALPPLGGWVAVQNNFDLPGWLLFALLFLWQIPHFFSLAWLYREDFKLGNFRMLSVEDPTGKAIGLHVMVTTVAMIGVTVVLWQSAQLNLLYLIGSLLLGGYLLVAVFRFWKVPEDGTARKMLIACYLYLPAQLLLLLVGKW